MSAFKAQMHQIRFLLGLGPRLHQRSLQCSPRPLAVFKCLLLTGGEGKVKRRGVGGRDLAHPKLLAWRPLWLRALQSLLNPAPSAPCLPVSAGAHWRQCVHLTNCHICMLSFFADDVFTFIMKHCSVADDGDASCLLSGWLVGHGQGAF